MAAADASAPSEAVSASASTAPIAPIAPIEKVAASVPVTVPATETKAVTNAVFTAPAAPVAAPVAAAAAGELRLRFAADTWYEIRDRNGKVVLGGTARAGQDVAGGGTPPYKVVIGNVKGVESMTRNGAPVDLQAANHNNVAHITLP
jgi:cytoskeleton protein RodZ